MKKFIYSSLAVAMLASFAVAQTTPWAEKGCVAFVNGTGDYNQNCYNSGLLDMADGKCYTFNTERGPVPQWINNVASQTWWWVETECVAAPEVQPVEPRDPSTYTLEDKGCIPFVNGTGDYNQHCYISGLLDMAEGKCYTYNTERGPVPQWINNVASQTWWWVETECADTVLVSSSSSDISSSSEESSSSEVSSSSDCSGTELAENCEDSSSSSEESSSSSEESSSSVEYTDKCITYVHGAGHYAENCYKAGLNNMAEGKCYELNPDRVEQYGNALYINPTATDPYWWQETECAQVEVVPPPDPDTYELQDKGCIEYVHGAGNWTTNCYNAGLNGMEEGKCYEIKPARYAQVANQQYINGNAFDTYWWQETLCADTVFKSEPKPAKPEPKFAAGKALEVVATTADIKTLRVFDMNGKLLHSESFTGAIKDVDFAKFAGNGVRLVRITSGNKLVAMKRIAAR